MHGVPNNSHPPYLHFKWRICYQIMSWVRAAIFGTYGLFHWLNAISRTFRAGISRNHVEFYLNQGSTGIGFPVGMILIYYGLDDSGWNQDTILSNRYIGLDHSRWNLDQVLRSTQYLPPDILRVGDAATYQIVQNYVSLEECSDMEVEYECEM